MTAHEVRGQNPPLLRAELIALHNSVNNSRNNQDRVLWNLNAIFWAAQAVLVNGLARGQAATTIPLNAVAWIGMFLSVVWFLLQRRAIGHLARYEEIVEEIENELVQGGLPPRFMTSGKVNKGSYERHFTTPGFARNLMQATSVAAMLLWGWALRFVF